MKKLIYSANTAKKARMAFFWHGTRGRKLRLLKKEEEK
jgi:hypothetical protein